MPLSKLDSKAALIVIDLQKGVLGTPTIHPSSEIVRRAAELARAFRERQWPVVLVNVSGAAPGRTDAGPAKLPSAPGWDQLVAELDPKPNDIRITKQRWGAFNGTALQEELRRTGVTQLFFAGVSTSIGVESSARAAFDLGYNVVIVTDAITDRNLEAHTNSVERIFPRMAETDTTEHILKALSEKAPLSERT